MWVTRYEKMSVGRTLTGQESHLDVSVLTDQ